MCCRPSLRRVTRPESLSNRSCFETAGWDILGLVDQFVDRSLPVTKGLEHMSSGRVREELEDVGHS